MRQMVCAPPRNAVKVNSAITSAASIHGVKVSRKFYLSLEQSIVG